MFKFKNSFALFIAFLTICSLNNARANLDELPDEILFRHILSYFLSTNEILKEKGSMSGTSPLGKVTKALRLVNRKLAAQMSSKSSPLEIGIKTEKPSSWHGSSRNKGNANKELSALENPSHCFPARVFFWGNPTIADIKKLAKVSSKIHSLRLTPPQPPYNEKEGLEVLSAFTNLIRLNLQGGQYLKNASFLESLVNLEELELYGAYIPENQVSLINKLEKLRKLWFQGGSLKSAPLCSNLKKLNRLGINNNSLETIDGLAGLRELTDLDLGSNYSLKQIGPVATLSSLKVLNLSRTRVNDLRPLAQLFSLRVLNLSATAVDNLMDLSQLFSLRELDISNTKVKDLAPIQNLKDLEELEVDGIQTISTFKPLSNLVNLLSLNIDLTRVDNFEFMRHLTKLKRVIVEEGFWDESGVFNEIEKSRPDMYVAIVKHDYDDDD